MPSLLCAILVVDVRIMVTEFLPCAFMNLTRLLVISRTSRHLKHQKKMKY